MTDTASHRYEILGVLGQGGFGTVYRARMDGGDGFVKDVAIKLLKSDDAPESELRRFRDESRILGLVRDRAVIRVDPPIRLDGRWGVVMEYADGVSATVLLKQRAFPPRVALEIVQEVARALDSVYTQPGPDGEPLRLLHRDLKPSNLQITPSGEVKILDFGIARADFEHREALTTHSLAGTVGYIAPERFQGHESPSGDVYSLGVVLRALVTRMKPRKGRRIRASDFSPDVQRVLKLASAMVSGDPEQRPSAEEVEERARSLAADIGGVSLRAYAREHVPSGAVLPDDHLVGQVLTGSTLSPAVAGKTSERSWVVSGVVTLLGLLVLLGIAAGGAVWAWMTYGGPSNDPTIAADQASLPRLEAEGVTGPDGASNGSEPTETPSATTPDAVAELDGEVGDEAVVGQLGTCPEALALEPRATLGRLSSEERACATQMAHDTGQSQTTRAKYGRVVLVNSQTRCASSGVCDEYEREQRFFFEEIDRSDPDMLYAWTAHLFGKGVADAQRRTEVITWADRALERKNVWKGTTHVERVDSLYEMLARSHYAGFEAAPTDRGARIKAQNAAIEWLTYRSQLGKDHSEALKLCESASGSRSLCTDRMFDPGLQVVVTFVSVPIGATVMVDGETVGQAPVVAELSHGVHSVEMVGSDTRGSTQITVGSERETRWIWRSGTDAWEGSF